MTTKIPFDYEMSGYNKVQVDSYLQLLTEAYSEAFAEYELICRKYNQLLDKFYYGEGAKQNIFEKECQVAATRQTQADGEYFRNREKPHTGTQRHETIEVEKTLEDYYREAMELDTFVDSLALKRK